MVSDFVGILPQATMLALLILVFVKAVAANVPGRYWRRVSRHTDIALLPLTIASLAIAASHIARVSG